MNFRDSLAARWPKHWPLQPLEPTRWAQQRPTYRDAQPTIIDAALRRAQQRPSGNWYVFAASADVRADCPLGATVAGIELVAWRDAHGALRVGSGACPHLGADLRGGRIENGALICPWHGLRLRAGDESGWTSYPGHDDGLLAWVRLDAVGGEEPSDHPVIAARPTGSTLHAVARLAGTCEPSDIIANRLDPWHGAWLHPYSFTHLNVISAPPIAVESVDQDRFIVAVTFRIGSLGVPVITEFASPEPRTIVMRIVEGEGVGSVVETHATPLGHSNGTPRTAVLEAVVAQSDRGGFAVARRAARLITPLMRRAATRLWRDDLAYAERRYHLRQQGDPR